MYKVIRLVLEWMAEIPKCGHSNESYTELYFLCELFILQGGPYLLSCGENAEM